MLSKQLILEGVSGSWEIASEEDIRAIESEFGFSLPTDYADFLRTYGASAFKESAVFLPKEPSPWAVNGVESFEYFYGPSLNEVKNIISVNRRLKDSVPGGMIAIGRDLGSNQLLINSTGKVMLQEVDSGDLFLVANSFSDFLDSFSSEV